MFWRTDKFLIFPGLASIALFFISLLVALYNLIGLGGASLVVRFDVLSGIHLFGGLGLILGIIFVGGLYLALDLALAWYLYPKKPRLSYLCAYTGLFLSALILIYVGVIISVN